MSAQHVDQFTDAPIEDQSLDRLGRTDFAMRIARTISVQSDSASLVVGLYGPWGDGKTSMLRLVEAEFAGNESIVSVRFNPWQLGDELSVFRGFFATVANALDKKMESVGQSIGKLLKSYGGLLKPIPFVGGVASDVAAVAGDKLADGLASLDEQKKAIEKILTDAGKRIVVFIDDIDRLDDTEIQVIFRLVKVAADFANTTYVLAFDDAVVSAALARRYTVQSVHGTNFLDKIVQLPLHLPTPDRIVLRSITLEILYAAIEQVDFSMNDLEARQFVNVFDRTVLPMLSTLRVSKRYGNALIFAVPMISEEVHVPDLLLIEAMRIFYKPLYEWVRVNPAAVLATPDHAVAIQMQETFDELTTGLPDAKRAGARALLNHLFPRTEAIWQNKQWGGDWLQVWSKSRRIASPDYFERYFTYTIGVHDVSDVDVAQYVELLNDGKATNDAEILATYLLGRHPTKFLVKLDGLVEKLSTTGREALALSLTLLGDAIPEHHVNQLVTARDLAVRLIVDAIWGLSEEAKQSLGTAAVKAAEPLPFAMDLFQQLRYRLNKDANTSGDVSKDCEASRSLGAILGTRVEQAWKKTPVDLGALGSPVNGLWVWAEYHATLDDVRAFMKARFEAEPALALATIKSSLPRAWDYETEMPLLGRVHRETYDAIAQFVDASTMVAALKTMFGEDIGSGDYYAKDDASVDERIAHQFVSIHLSVIAAQSQATQLSPDQNSAPSDGRTT